MRRLISLVAVGVAGLAGGCSSSAGHAAPPPPSTTGTVPATIPASTSVPTVSSSRTVAPTTAYSPSRPQASPDAAALALIQAWAAGDRSAAAAVASPAAVSAVMAGPYPAGYMQARGCTDPSFTPGTCTYANRQSGSLYEMQVNRSPAGWYVASVSVES